MVFLSNNKESFCTFFENKTGENDFELDTEKDFIPFFTEDKLEYLIKKSILSPSSKVAVENVDDDFSEEKIVRKIVILGLENSGKSTLVAQLSKKGNHYMEYKPTKGFNVKCISFDNCDLSIWEIGGEEDYRVYWRNFSYTTDMIIFVIDSSDRNKFKSAKTFFSEILENLHETVNLHILATKVDKNQSASLEELYSALELEKSIWEIHKVSMVTEDATENIELARDTLKSYGKTVIGGIISPTHDMYKKKGLIASKHRVQMCQLATNTSNWIRVSSWESEQDSWQRTVKVLRHVDQDANKVYGVPVHVKFLCGADLMESFSVPDLWKTEDIEEIVGKHGLVVITRAGSNPQKFIENSSILSKFKSNIDIVEEWILNEISATKIRTALSRGESIRYLVPDTVIDYIEKNKLYC
ncbi:uncharacterized protein LOC100214495 isoform X1 [Hydra vulgaris]|uniref:uncharacterized protein LOC100214495 isoform X1 n=1 Tax=Hydra vulgaris TaxID=6087 RepID=UPI0032EA4E6D